MSIITSLVYKYKVFQIFITHNITLQYKRMLHISRIMSFKFWNQLARNSEEDLDENWITGILEVTHLYKILRKHICMRARQSVNGRDCAARQIPRMHERSLKDYFIIRADGVLSR